MELNEASKQELIRYERVCLDRYLKLVCQFIAFRFHRLLAYCCVRVRACVGLEIGCNARISCYCLINRLLQKRDAETSSTEERFTRIESSVEKLETQQGVLTQVALEMHAYILQPYRFELCVSGWV